MGRPRKDGTPAQSSGEVKVKPDLTPDTIVINHLQQAYYQADGVLSKLGENDPTVHYYLTIATTTAELISYMRPEQRMWGMVAAGNRANLDKLDAELEAQAQLARKNAQVPATAK